MMKTDKCFLETTIQINRNFSSKENQNKLRELLSDSELVSSIFVLREFKKLMYKNCIALLEIARKCDTASDLETKIAQRFSHEVKYLLIIKAQVMRECNELYSKELFTSILENYLNNELEKKFLFSLSGINNKTNCEIAKEEILKNLPEADDDDQYIRYTIKYSCNKKNINCNISKLIEKNKRIFPQLEKCDKRTHKDEIENILLVYKDIKDSNNDYSVCKGQLNCNKLGDILIALEANSDETLLSTDHHFDFICPILKRKHRRIDLPN